MEAKTEMFHVEQKETTPKKSKPSAQVEVDRPAFLRHLKEGLAKTGLTLAESQLNQMADYYELLLAGNQVMNLTGITEAHEVAEKHVADSLMVAAFLQEGDAVLDLGSGAGLPGIPLAIACPGCSFVLVDSLQKRCRFLEEVAAKLQLPNVRVIHGRAEELARLPEQRQQYQVATARAVAALPVLAEYTLPFLRLGGKLVAMKGSQGREELAAAQKALQVLGGGKASVQQYTLQTGETRTLLVVMKARPTPKAYPRKPGNIKKNPL